MDLTRTIAEASKADEAQACLTAIFLTNPIDDRERLKYLKGTRIDGTCTWIKAHELYKSWLSSQSQLLWLSGDPGKGKTSKSFSLILPVFALLKSSAHFRTRLGTMSAGRKTFKSNARTDHECSAIHFPLRGA